MQYMVANTKILLYTGDRRQKDGTRISEWVENLLEKYSETKKYKPMTKYPRSDYHAALEGP